MYTDRFGFSRCAVLKLYRHRFGSAPQPGSAGSASWPGPVSPVRHGSPIRSGFAGPVSHPVNRAAG